jgi:hypothetical protein
MPTNSLYIYWCPRCQVQSQRAVHLCESGPPLLPQLDEETVCERIDVISTEHANKIAERLEAVEDDLERTRGSMRAATEEAAGYRRALMQVRELDEDDFQSAWHYQQAVRMYANSALLEPKSVPKE